MKTGVLLTLSELSPGTRALVVDVGGGSEAFTRALLEMGVLEGSEVQVLYEAPISRDPIAVQIRGALIALRRSEAQYIRVKVMSEVDA